MACVLVLSVTACGDEADDTQIDNAEAKQAANKIMLTSIRLLTGDSAPQEYIELFVPECRTRVDDSAVATTMTLLQAVSSQLSDVTVREVDVGPIELEPQDGGTLVTLADLESFRINVDGNFVAAQEWLAELGFGASGNPLAQSLLLVRRDGQVLIADCTRLEVFSSDAGR
jgi:hypothetical protein